MERLASIPWAQNKAMGSKNSTIKWEVPRTDGLGWDVYILLHHVDVQQIDVARQDPLFDQGLMYCYVLITSKIHWVMSTCY